jgi:hypothetical protein
MSKPFTRENPQFDIIELDMPFSDKDSDANNDILLKSIKDKVHEDDYDDVTEIIDKIQGEIIDVFTEGGIISLRTGITITLTNEEQELISNLDPVTVLVESLVDLKYYINKTNDSLPKTNLLKKLDIFEDNRFLPRFNKLSIITTTRKPKSIDAIREAFAQRFNDEIKELGFYFHFKSKTPNAKRVMTIGASLFNGAYNSINFES